MKCFGLLCFAALLILPSCSSAPKTPDFVMSWPVENARLTQGFRGEGRDLHLGLDLAWKKGTPVLSAHSGVVVYAGSGFRGFGKMVLIENESGWASIYAHLDRIHVKTGQRVRNHQGVGTMGRTGRASGVHLHFEVRYKRHPINPLSVLPEQVLKSRLASN